MLIQKVLEDINRSPDFHRSRYGDDDHLHAAISWIETAWKAAGETGISKGYDLIRRRWSPAYPETTGYTIPTLLNLAVILKRPDLAEMALRLAEYLLKASDPNGAVVHWQAGGGAQPVIFDTGQVLFGLLAAFQYSGDARYLDAGVRAGNWLVSVQSSSGSWVQYQHLGTEKVIDTRVAWALLLLDRQVGGNPKYRLAARKNLDWAVSQQDQSGWFDKCAFRLQDDPLTHTLAYTAEGLYESGLLLGEESYCIHGRKTADQALAHQKPNGSLPGTFGTGWTRPAWWSCLTGNVQFARLWLLLYRDTGEPHYYSAARQGLSFVMNCQDLEITHPAVRGGIAGSFPIYGAYERLKYPNWASKFFIDAILAISLADERITSIVYQG
ncbi:MAG TPA: hypothetical protein PK150_10910 [Anaerolineaceae bacterium]|nr:hypothetical protein [Anaerolineaceae bacterium]